MRFVIDNNYFYKSDYFFLSVALFLFLVSSLMPLVALYAGLVILTLNGGGSDSSRRLLGVVVIFSASVVYSSREVFLTFSDDFSSYYDAYNDAVNGDWNSVIERFSNGIEIFTSLIFIGLSFIFGYLNPHHLLFILIFVVAVGFFVWLEVYGLEYVDDNVKSICVASVIALSSFSFFGQVVRQSQASVFILFALSQRRFLYQCIFIGLATSCHLTSPIIYFIFKLLMSDNSRIKIYLSSCLLVLSLLLQHLLEPIISNDWYGFFSVFNKAQYYKEIGQGFVSVDIGSVKFIVFGWCSAILFLRDDVENKKWISLYFFGGVFYLSLLPYPLLPTRLMLIYSVFLMGYFMFFSFQKKLILYQFLLFFYVVYTFLNRLSTLKPSGGGFDLWYSFPWFKFQPFYYFF